MVSIVIADDHEVVRQGIRAVLRRAPDMNVVAEAADGMEAIQAVNRHRPDILLVDISMPKQTGLQVVRDVRSISPATRSIVLSMHTEPMYIVQALRDGASGYILKDASSSEVLDGIRHVMAGRRYLSAGISANAIEAHERHLEPQSVDVLETLTQREREVLRLVGGGLTSGEIAERLGISTRTVETHRANLMRKIGAKRTSDLIVVAVSRGLF